MLPQVRCWGWREQHFARLEATPATVRTECNCLWHYDANIERHKVTCSACGERPVRQPHWNPGLGHPLDVADAKRDNPRVAVQQRCSGSACSMFRTAMLASHKQDTSTAHGGQCELLCPCGQGWHCLLPQVNRERHTIGQNCFPQVQGASFVGLQAPSHCHRSEERQGDASIQRCNKFKRIQPTCSSKPGHDIYRPWGAPL